MRISDFDYTLPPDLIAQTPVEPRDSSRLLVVHRETGALEHRIFRDLPTYLRPGDLLVANQSRVLPARLLGEKVETGGRVELLLLSVRGDLGPDYWEALVRPGKRVHTGQTLSFGGGALLAEPLDATPAGGRIVRLRAREGTVAEAIARVGVAPLPPYIHERLADAERYQTVYAREPGSAAAPTAGLHFTDDLLARVREMGVGIAYVTLHIGLDTFRPVEEDDLTDHVMHSEEIEVSQQAAEAINATRAAGGRVIAIGTTSVRTLEAVGALAAEQGAPGPVISYRGRTRLFIAPGFSFRVVDAMVTNFHLPRSTLLALVSAFAGRERMLSVYAEAIAQQYRFYSFGDAMLLL